MFEREEGEETRRDAFALEREFDDRLHAGDWVAGRLLGHGKAPYLFEKENSASFFVSLRTSHGVRDLWGADLERAFRDSKSHVKDGDAVAVRITSREKMYNNRTLNLWQIDTAIFVVQQRRVAREILENPVTARQRGREHPEIVGSYLLVRAAELLASNRYSDKATRERFVAKMREAAGLPPTPVGPRQKLPTPALTASAQTERREGLREPQPANAAEHSRLDIPPAPSFSGLVTNTVHRLRREEAFHLSSPRAPRQETAVRDSNQQPSAGERNESLDRER